MTHAAPPPSNRGRSRIARALWAVGVMVVVGLVAILLRTPRKPEEVDPATATAAVIPIPRPQPVSHDFAGSQACAKCHAEIMQKYAGHPMAHSLATVQEATPLEKREQTEFSPIPALTYYVEHKDNQVIHHEVRKDAEGNVMYDQGIPVHYAVGSGERGRTYLTNDSGRLSASMISWFSDGNLWSLSPGYRPEDNERFERRASDGCLACHSGRMAVEGHDLNRFQDSPFLEMAIGCERCHGPAKEHIVFREKGVPAPGAVDPIVNPGHFADARRDAVCGQCHLQGRRRVVQYGRSEFDFRPGMFLSDNWTVFIKTAGVKSGRAAAVSQVEQMYASQCYMKSDAKLSCIHCHDPHSIPAEEHKSSFYRDRCLKCHSSGQPECAEKLEVRQAGTIADSCIHCHMPSFPAKDVHAAQTDHRVLRRPADPALEKPVVDLTSLPPRDINEIVLFEEPGYSMDPIQESRARGIHLSEHADKLHDEQKAHQAIDLLVPIVERAKDDIEAHYSLGQAFSVAKQPNYALRGWLMTLELQPTHEEALEALALHYHQTGNQKEARKYYEKLLKVNPSRSHFYGRFAHILGQLGDVEAAKAAANRSLEINPSLVQAHAWLAEMAQKQGDQALADQHTKLVEQFQSTQNPKPPMPPRP